MIQLLLVLIDVIFIFRIVWLAFENCLLVGFLICLKNGQISVRFVELFRLSLRTRLIVILVLVYIGSNYVLHIEWSPY